jgi:hypothetical protein
VESPLNAVERHNALESYEGGDVTAEIVGPDSRS